MEKTVITINLDAREEAGVLSIEQLIQHEAIAKFGRLLQEAYNGAEEYKKISSSSEKPFDRMLNRSYNTITLHGHRGSGKTTLLNSLIDCLHNYKQSSVRNIMFSGSGVNVDRLLGSVYVLDVIDPGLVETKEHVLITIICLIKDAVDQHFDKHSGDKLRRTSWEEALTRLSEGLTRLDKIGPQNPHESWEDALYITQKGLQSAQGSIVFEAALSTFVRLSLDILGKTLFLIAFDDIDTAIDRGYDVLEIIRKYLATPLILVVLAGDLDLYSKIVRLQHWNKFDPSNLPDGERGVYLKKVDELDDQYMMKLLKPSNRIELMRLDTIFNTLPISKNYEAKVEYDSKNNGLINKPLEDFINSAISKIYGIAQKDQVDLYRSLILRQPTRTVMQFLRTFAKTESTLNIAPPDVLRSIAEIALGPLLRNGLNVDQIISANPQRLLLLTRDYINRRGLWQSGHRLHPDIRDEEGDDTNLVILALSASMTSGIRQNPSVIFEYFVKLCLPHSAFEYVPQTEGKITEYLNFISSKSYEDSRTEARQNIAVIVWKQTKETRYWIVGHGVVRVVSDTQQQEVRNAFGTRDANTDTAVKFFWSLTNGKVVKQNVTARLRTEYNTIKTLAGDKRPKGRSIKSSLTMRNVALLPFVEVVDH